MTSKTLALVAGLVQTSECEEPYNVLFACTTAEHLNNVQHFWLPLISLEKLSANNVSLQDNKEGLHSWLTSAAKCAWPLGWGIALQR